ISFSRIIEIAKIPPPTPSMTQATIAIPTTADPSLFPEFRLMSRAFSKVFLRGLSLLRVRRFLSDR
ncbi:MAG: hypothetical protein AAF517_25150, partial [Planctomycetota bacterium]